MAKKKTAKRPAKSTRRTRAVAIRHDDQLAAIIEQAVARVMAASVHTSPTSIRPVLEAAKRGDKAPAAAPSKAKAAVTADVEQLTGWDRAFIKTVVNAGGVTAKQQPAMDRINAKLRALGEPTIDLPRRRKGDPTPAQLAARGAAPAAKAQPKERAALGRTFADIELTRMVAEALRGAPRGLTMGGLIDVLVAVKPDVSVSTIHGAIGTLVDLGVARKAERKGQVVYLAA